MDDPRDPRDPHSDLPPSQWQLRVLNGPARGTICLLGERLAIGRSASSDLQLEDQEVSRQHATIFEDDHGRHVLVDLDSSNGTYVDGEAVVRHVLEPHVVFTIADVELVYEPVPTPAQTTATLTLRDPRLDVQTFRSTAEHPVLVARTHAPTTPVGAAVPAHAVLDRDGRALVFERNDGTEYDGNLIDDIIEYRMLRAQHLRGGFGEPSVRRSFERLRDRLQQPPSPDPRLAQRAFCRFGCWLPAHVRLTSGEALPCHVRDFGVDGAQLVLDDHDLCTEVIAWLAIDVIEDGQPRSIMLAGRVAWTDGEFVGLAFAGAPARVDGRYAEQPARRETLHDQHPSARLHPRGLRLTSDPDRG